MTPLQMLLNSYLVPTESNLISVTFLTNFLLHLRLSSLTLLSISGISSHPQNS